MTLLIVIAPLLYVFTGVKRPYAQGLRGLAESAFSEEVRILLRLNTSKSYFIYLRLYPINDKKINRIGVV